MIVTTILHCLKLWEYMKSKRNGEKTGVERSVLEAEIDSNFGKQLPEFHFQNPLYYGQ